MLEPTVLVDQDNVLADFEAGFYDAWTATHPDAPAILPSERTTHLVSQQLGLEWRIAARAVISAPGFFHKLPAVPGALAALEQMRDDGLDVWICTSPPLTSAPTAATDKHLWVRDHLGEDWESRLIVTPDKTIIRASYLIDDATVIAGSHIPEFEHILFDRPYNQNNTDLRRLVGWKNWRELIFPSS